MIDNFSDLPEASQIICVALGTVAIGFVFFAAQIVTLLFSARRE